MRTAVGALALLLHIGLMAAAAPVLAGLLGVLHARLAGRVGPPVLQPWRDWRSLLRKQPVLPESASLLLPLAPLVALACLAAAAALVPSFTLGMASAPAADMVVIAGLLTGARMAMALAGFESGAAIGGVAASRTMSLAVLTEAALLLAVFAVSTIVGSTNLDSVATVLQESGSGLRVSLGLAAAAAAIVALVETGRYQAGGSLLALGHDTVGLALSGWYSAAADIAAALRLLVWLCLLIVMFAPIGIAPADGSVVGWVPGLLAWATKLAVLGGVIGIIQARRVDLRWRRAPELLAIALVLGVLAAVFLFVGRGLA